MRLLAGLICLLVGLSAFPLESKLSGYVKMRYTWDEAQNPQTNLSVKDARIIYTLKISDLSTFLAELNALPSGVGVKYCFIQVKTERGNLQFGQIKVPFGYELPLSGGLLETPTIAGVLDKLFPKQTYDKGIRFNAKNWEIALVNGNGEQQTSDDNNAKDLALHYISRKDAFSYGASLYFGKQRAGMKDVTKNRYGAELIWRKGKSTITSEAVWGRDEDEGSHGWYVKYRYNLPSISYVAKYEYYDGVSSYDAKNNRWTTTTIKALTLGPMLFLDKNTMVIPMYSWREGKKNDSFILELRVVY